jgi:hypothetical protein
VLEQSIDDLKVSLKHSEQKNRQLKLAIDELQSHHSDSHLPGSPQSPVSSPLNHHITGTVVSVPPQSINIPSVPVVWNEPVHASFTNRTMRSPEPRSSARIFGKVDDKLQVQPHEPV